MDIIDLDWWRQKKEDEKKKKEKPKTRADKIREALKKFGSNRENPNNTKK